MLRSVQLGEWREGRRRGAQVAKGRVPNSQKSCLLAALRLLNEDRTVLTALSVIICDIEQ